MDWEVIAKTGEVPPYDSAVTKVQYIEGEAEVTEKVISGILKRIPRGIDVCLFLDPDGEDSFLEILSDGEWCALGCSYDCGQENYYSYNPAYEASEEYTALRSGGQSPVQKRFALTDMDAACKAAEYFIRTGERYPGIDWARQL